ncbi:hypothetical protein ABEF95_012089 [Exophiala dermatitidis]
MGRGKADRASSSAAQPADQQDPQYAPRYPDRQGTATERSLPDHAMESQQGEGYGSFAQDRIDIYKLVDSWRSYRADAGNLQTATDPQGYQTTYRQAMPEYQPQPTHHQSQLTTNPAVRAYQPSQTLQPPPSYYAPYQALRFSDGSYERQVVQQAQLAMNRTVPQQNKRYSLRQRRIEQIAPYSTGAAAALAHRPLPSLEAPDAPAPSVPTTSLPVRNVVSRRSRTRTATPEVQSPPPPKPSAEYMRKAGLPPARRATPQKLLVILDLNGTLLVRPNRRSDPKKFKIRPGVTQLLDYLFEHHVVMIYSSTRPENALPMVNNLIHPKQRQLMAGVWARDKLDLSKAQYNNKVQVYKRLHKIWADKDIQSKAEPGRKWDQSNTILVDDSHLKALAQPHNLLQVPEFENNAPKEGGPVLRDWQLKEQAILESLQQKLEELKWQVDVSRLIREWQSGKRQAPGVVDETVDQKTHRNIQEQQLEPPQQQEPLSPTPSVGQPETSGLWLSSPQSAEQEAAFPPSHESCSPAGGVNVSSSEQSILDRLEQEIDRSLNPENAVRKQKQDLEDTPRSVSPIDESVWKELLSGREKDGDGDRNKDKFSRRDIPPTPESMGV